MGVINFIISLSLIFLLLKAPPLISQVGQELGNISLGYKIKYEQEKEKNNELTKRIEELSQRLSQSQTQTTSPTKVARPTFNYSGDDIFRAINDYRRSSAVGELSLDPNLCYLSSFRLSQLLDLGKLDAHQGFIDFDPANRFKYERVGEDLAFGYQSARETVDAWEKSPGHNLVLKDPINTLGCVAANRGYAVFIAGRER